MPPIVTTQNSTESLKNYNTTKFSSNVFLSILINCT